MMAADNRDSTRPGLRRFLCGANLIAYLGAVSAIAVAINLFAHHDGFRWRFDSTKTRAYSLSPQTEQLLGTLQGEWTISVIMVEAMTDAAVARQVGEVLSRYDAASPHIAVQQIDPTDPASLIHYEALLARLRGMYGGVIGEYDMLLDDAAGLFDEFQIFAQQQSLRLGQAQRLVTDDVTSKELETWPGRMSLWAEEGPRILAMADEVRSVSEARPIPDYETARSVFAEALGQAAQELDDVSRLLERWRRGTNDGLRQFAITTVDDYVSLAQRMLTVSDSLRQLPPLEISSIGAQLAGGEAAVILGPAGAAVIPSAQLFPRLGDRSDALAFDQRFRGEQIISSAVRSMLVERMPRVIFVHSEEGSMLRQREQNADLFGVASTLIASRFEVSEWNVRVDDRPLADPEQPIVWVIVPPMQRALEPSRFELTLLNAARTLLAEGEAVMLNLNPSPLPKWGQPDPWLPLLESMSLSADTGRVIYESLPVGESERQTRRAQLVHDFRAEHPIARAVHGQQTAFPLPVALRMTGEAASLGISRHALVQVRPHANRWLEEDWNLDPRRLDPPTSEERLLQTVPIGVAIEGPSAGTTRPQRLLVFGSGGWLHTYVADEMGPLGGGMSALMNPGNHEMMLASVAWLAGMDDLIAASAVSQQVARLDGITPTVQRTWRFIMYLGVPVVCLLLGVIVAFLRRL